MQKESKTEGAFPVPDFTRHLLDKVSKMTNEELARQCELDKQSSNAWARCFPDKPAQWEIRKWLTNEKAAPENFGNMYFDWKTYLIETYDTETTEYILKHGLGSYHNMLLLQVQLRWLKSLKGTRL
jgi:hypothetical protein